MPIPSRASYKAGPGDGLEEFGLVIYLPTADHHLTLPMCSANFSTEKVNNELTKELTNQRNLSPNSAASPESAPCILASSKGARHILF